MKIGFDAKRAFLNESGLGNYSRNTLNCLQKYYPENRYVLFTPQIRDDLFKNYNDFDVISPDSSLAKIFKSIWRSFSVSGQLKKQELDLFHGLSNELPEGSQKTRVPLVVTIHDLIFMRYPQFYRPVDRNIYYRKVKFACASATKIIAISRQTQEDIIHYFKVKPEKTEVVYQSVAPPYFTHTEKQVPSELEISGDYILCVGTIEHRKNQLALLKALKAANINLQVVFVGKPTIYATELLAYISANQMENQVKFLNSLPRKTMAALYQNALFSVYISLFEGFGLPVIESMASGCPVITSNTSCLPETAGGAALLCNPSDTADLASKLQKLAGDSNLRNELREKGFVRAGLCHPEVYSKNLISLYSEIVT